MYIVENAPWIDTDEKTIYLVKTQSGPGGQIIGYATVYKERSVDPFVLVNDSAWSDLKEMKK